MMTCTFISQYSNTLPSVYCMPDMLSLPQEINGWICNLNIHGSNISYVKKIQNTALQHDRFCPKQSVEEDYELTLNKEQCVHNSSRCYRTSIEMYECSSPFLSVVQALIWRLHCFRLCFNFGPIYLKK